MAQDEVQILSDWTYGTLYSSDWSVENMFDTTEIIDATGEEIGDVENVTFTNDDKVLGIIAEVRVFWDIGEAMLHKSCPEDSPHESSVIAGVHEQLDSYELQDQKLVTL